MTFTESSDIAGFKLAYGGALTVGSFLAAAAAFLPVIPLMMFSSECTFERSFSS